MFRFIIFSIITAIMSITPVFAKKGDVKLDVKFLDEDDAEDFLEDFAYLINDEFQSFPYLMTPQDRLNGEVIARFLKPKTSKLMIGYLKDKPISYAISCGLSDESGFVKDKFEEQNLPLKEYYFVGYLVTNEEYRGKGYFKQLVNAHIKYARSKKYKYAVFLSVQREEDHPSRPENYVSHEVFWKSIKATKMKDMQVEIPWERIDTGEVEKNTLDVWKVIL